MAYGKIDATFWHDRLMRSLPEASRYFVLYLLSCSHRNRLGCFVLDPFYAAADLQWPSEKVEEQLEILTEKGRIGYDPETRVVFIKRFLRHNILENRNVVLGAIKELSTIPDSPLLFPLLAALEENRRGHYDDILTALRNRLHNHYPNGMPNDWGNRCRHLTLPYPALPYPDQANKPGNKTSSPTPVTGEERDRQDVDFSSELKRCQPLAKKNIIRIHGGTDKPIEIEGALVGVGLDVTRYQELAGKPGQDPELVAMAIQYLPEVTGLEPPVSLARWGPNAPDGWAVFEQCKARALTELERAYPTEPNDPLSQKVPA